MQFNTLHFFIFLAIVTIVYFSTPFRYRPILLLAASYYFYMCWKPEYAVLILIVTLINYFAGLGMGAARNPRRRKILLTACMAVSLGQLFIFKYFNFFTGSLNAAFQHFNILTALPQLKVLLPVGISFYTLQAMGYSMDVYRGVKAPEKNFLIFALFVSFFPQLVSGPIERSTRLIPQFRENKNFDYKMAVDGLRLILWGLFLKMVVADRLSIFVDAIYSDPEFFSGIALLLAVYFYTFQIYCDFAGYSYIAKGCAGLLGIDIMDNFNKPYFSRSIRDFWRRWHISLSTWFRDYLYIPLGGNRVPASRHYFNIMIVFLLSGLWHGANWTFLFWGGLHGCFLICFMAIEDFRAKARAKSAAGESNRLFHFLSIMLTFHLVVFAWIFFRSDSIARAFRILKNIFRLNPDSFRILLAFDRIELAVAVISIIFMELVHGLCKNKSLTGWLSGLPAGVRWSFYVLLALSITYLGVVQEVPFIYFQF